MTTNSNNFHFQTTLVADISTINYGGHLAHDRLITLMHEARIQFLKHIGQSEVSFYGTGLIAKSLQVDYLKEAFWGEELTFQLSVINPSGAGFTVDYAIFNAKQQPIAKASIVILCFDYEKRKVARLSKQFLTDIETAKAS